MLFMLLKSRDQKNSFINQLHQTKTLKTQLQMQTCCGKRCLNYQGRTPPKDITIIKDGSYKLETTMVAFQSPRASCPTQGQMPPQQSSSSSSSRVSLSEGAAQNHTHRQPATTTTISSSSSSGSSRKLQRVKVPKQSRSDPWTVLGFKSLKATKMILYSCVLKLISLR
jgi:hypothetical protein